MVKTQKLPGQPAPSSTRYLSLLNQSVFGLISIQQIFDMSTPERQPEILFLHSCILRETQSLVTHCLIQIYSLTSSSVHKDRFRCCGFSKRSQNNVLLIQFWFYHAQGSKMDRYTDASAMPSSVCNSYLLSGLSLFSLSHTTTLFLLDLNLDLSGPCNMQQSKKATTK